MPDPSEWSWKGLRSSGSGDPSGGPARAPPLGAPASSWKGLRGSGTAAAAPLPYRVWVSPPGDIPVMPLLGAPSAFCSTASENGLAAGAGARTGQLGAPNPVLDPGDAGAPPAVGRHQCRGRRLRTNHR